MTHRLATRTALEASRLAILICVAQTSAAANEQPRLLRDEFGAIIRGDTSKKQISLLFTGDTYGESTDAILDSLQERGIKAAFFVTGNFLRQPNFQAQLQRILADGHYLGPHSDSHPLYCDWKDRQKSLVTEAFFAADLRKNITDLRALGALSPGKPIYFISPYEWYNRQQVNWCNRFTLDREKSAGPVKLINFTPGSGSNRDYAPENDSAFVPSREIYDDILAYERRDPSGLNGFLLLLHLGSGRTDPFHKRLGALVDELQSRGYDFVRIDNLLCR